MPEMTAAEFNSIIRTMEELSKNAHRLASAGNKVVPADDIDKALEILRRFASGELAPVIHAHWIKNHEASIFGNCSKCGVIGRVDYDYCEGCGALMDGKDDEDAEIH